MVQQLTESNVIEFLANLRSKEESVGEEFEFEDGIIHIEYDNEPNFSNPTYDGGSFDVTIYFNEEKDNWESQPNDVSKEGDKAENKVARAVSKTFGRNNVELDWEHLEDGIYTSTIVDLSMFEPTDRENF